MFFLKCIGLEGGETPYIGNRLQRCPLSTIQYHGPASVKIYYPAEEENTKIYRQQITYENI